MAEINVRELHPAIIGLMREMAYSRHPMTAKRKADFRVALIALLEFLYDEDGDVYVKKC